MRLIVAAIAMLAAAATAEGAVRLPDLFGDGMVLQRDSPLRVWGWADPEEEVRVELLGRQARGRADRKGRWELLLGPYPGGGPYTMTVAGKNTLTLRDVLIGDVWLASGQSNMEWPVSADGVKIDRADEELAKAHFPHIRLYVVDHQPALTAQSDARSGHWRAVDPQSAAEFSAVAYLFGKEIHERYQVPIGLIQSTWGGTVIQAWMSGAALRGFPELHSIVQAFERVSAQGDALAPFVSPEAPTSLFNGMIHPLRNYRIRGVIWYQGEQNADTIEHARQYRSLFPALIRDWRAQWGYELPFLYVQLAGFGPNQPEPAEYPWAELREAQSMALALPRTAMASAVDIGNETDIHPTNKQDVAHRLALAAGSVVYGEHLVHSGPRYRAMHAESGRARIEFSDRGSGLVFRSKYGYGQGFEIAGADGKFHWAQARLEREEVIVFSDEVGEPVAVRYGWTNTPDGNLYNREGLPAVPFRTDAPLDDAEASANRFLIGDSHEADSRHRATRRVPQH
jgi:sialate O-acetylesterase